MTLEQSVFEDDDDYFDNEYDNDILSLSRLSNCIDSLFGKKEIKTEYALEEITELRASIDCAALLFLEYENAEDEDLKHEFGFQYSEIVANIGDQLEEINRLGNNLYIH